MVSHVVDAVHSFRLCCACYMWAVQSIGNRCEKKCKLATFYFYHLWRLKVLCIARISQTKSSKMDLFWAFGYFMIIQVSILFCLIYIKHKSLVYSSQKSILQSISVQCRLGGSSHICTFPLWDFLIIGLCKHVDWYYVLNVSPRCHVNLKTAQLLKTSREVGTLRSRKIPS